MGKAHHCKPLATAWATGLMIFPTCNGLLQIAAYGRNFAALPEDRFYVRASRDAAAKFSKKHLSPATAGMPAGHATLAEPLL